MDRPARLNAQTPQTWTWLRRVGADLPGRVRVVVVRGEGRSFSAGLDRAVLGEIQALAALPPDEARATVAGFQQGFGWLARPDLVSVAAVQGHAIGAGFQLALACDIRVAAGDAQFTMAETSLGLVPDLGGTKRLVELVGYSRAAEICLTGRRVTAEEALRIGLVSNVAADPADLAEAVDAVVAALLAPPREAVTETKALLLAASGRSQAEQEAAEGEAQHRRLRDLAQLFDER